MTDAAAAAAASVASAGVSASSGIDWLSAVGGVVGGGAFAQALQWFRERRKSSAEVHKMDAEATATLEGVVNEKLRALLDGYQRELDAARREIAALREEVVALRKALDARASQTGFGV